MYRDKQITAVILGRRSSSRLKDKIFLPFGNSTVIEAVIERIKESEIIDSFVLATSTNANDNVLKGIAGKLNIGFFAGSECDIVSRMNDSLRTVDPCPDIVVRVCSDNPLLMASIVDNAIVTLVDANADVITPYEFNTYPFGYSMVVMTKECLGRIDREAKENTYREHVENYCFEHPEKFRILYQKAPELLHFRDLNLTLDYDIDYIRLRQFDKMLAGIPIHKQPERLLEIVKDCKIGLIVTDIACAEEAHKIVLRKCSRVPVIFCLSNDVQSQNHIRIKNASELNIEYCGDMPVLINNIKSHNVDLIISTINVLDICDIKPDRGIVFVCTMSDGDQGVFCLKYECGVHVQSEDPIFIDFKPQASDETPEEFLIRIMPIVLPQLISGPIRSVNKDKTNFPPEGKLGKETRKGFRDIRSVYFPFVILVELVEAVRRKNGSELVSLNVVYVSKLIDEISKYFIKYLVIGVFNDPKEHREFPFVYKSIVDAIGKENTVLWPGGSMFKEADLKTSLFQQIVLTASGSLKYSINDTAGETTVGDYNRISIAEAWQSKKMQYARVDILNAVVSQ